MRSRLDISEENDTLNDKAIKTHDSSAKQTGFRLRHYLLYTVTTLLTLILCICVGSVRVSPLDAMKAISSGLFRTAPVPGMAQVIIMGVRLPRVLSVALVGSALSLCGAAMQGLLRNPLADGSTMGIASGASLGAVLSLAFGLTIPGLQKFGTMGMSMVFAFASLILVLSLSWKLDASLATNTIILIGVIFSMFVSAFVSLVIAFSGPSLRSITFWTMGSLSSASFGDAFIMLIALFLFGGALIGSARELNAFAIGEDNARSIGVNVRGVKLRIMVAVSVLIGLSVSIGGNIGFVGLVSPHMARLIVGPNHQKLLPAVLFSGAIFLMLTDLVARIILNPIELPLGVVTSLIGAVLFMMILIRSRRTT